MGGWKTTVFCPFLSCLSFSGVQKVHPFTGPGIQGALKMRCHHPGGVTSQLCHVVKLLGIYSMGIIVEKVTDFSGFETPEIHQQKSYSKKLFQLYDFWKSYHS